MRGWQLFRTTPLAQTLHLRRAFSDVPAQILEPVRRAPPSAFVHKTRAPGQRRNRTYLKHVGPRKKANKVMTMLGNEMKEELKRRQGIELPDYRVGDKVRVTFLQAKSEEKPDEYVGVIIANPRKGCDESILVRCAVKGDCFEVRVPIWSPLLKGLEIIQARCIHKGKKAGRRVRRSKLYYLRNREPSTYM